MDTVTGQYLTPHPHPPPTSKHVRVPRGRVKVTTKPLPGGVVAKETDTSEARSRLEHDEELAIAALQGEREGGGGERGGGGGGGGGGVYLFRSPPHSAAAHRSSANQVRPGGCGYCWCGLCAVTSDRTHQLVPALWSHPHQLSPGEHDWRRTFSHPPLVEVGDTIR